MFREQSYGRVCSLWGSSRCRVRRRAGSRVRRGRNVLRVFREPLGGVRAGERRAEVRDGKVIELEHGPPTVRMNRKSPGQFEGNQEPCLYFFPIPVTQSTKDSENFENWCRQQKRTVRSWLG